MKLRTPKIIPKGIEPQLPPKGGGGDDDGSNLMWWILALISTPFIIWGFIALTLGWYNHAIASCFAIGLIIIIALKTDHDFNKNHKRQDK